MNQGASMCLAGPGRDAVFVLDAMARTLLRVPAMLFMDQRTPGLMPFYRE